jgi:hypothetical protein
VSVSNDLLDRAPLDHMIPNSNCNRKNRQQEKQWIHQEEINTNVAVPSAEDTSKHKVLVARLSSPAHGSAEGKPVATLPPTYAERPRYEQTQPRMCY